MRRNKNPPGDEYPSTLSLLARKGLRVKGTPWGKMVWKEGQPMSCQGEEFRGHGEWASDKASVRLPVNSSHPYLLSYMLSPPGGLPGLSLCSQTSTYVREAGEYGTRWGVQEKHTRIQNHPDPD